MNEKDNIRKRKSLLRSCRYFENSDVDQSKLSDDQKTICYYESCWVDQKLREYETGEADLTLLSMIEEYKAAGLEDFEKDDHRDLSLKALLFNRYGRTISAPVSIQAEQFKEFYLSNYFSFEDDPQMIWTREESSMNDPCPVWNSAPMEARICQNCLNRLQDGSCELCKPIEQSAALINNKCEEYRKRHFESLSDRRR